MRLVTTGMPDTDGSFTGMLDIMLKPGWKTYWRDPGDAGVPPSLDVSRSANIASAELSFPAPARHDEGDFTWAGYDGTGRLARDLHWRKDPAQPVTLDADVFLGICQTICIPVKAEFQLDPAHDATNPDDAEAVKAAQAALPSPASPAFGATVTGRSGPTLTIAAKVPGDPTTADIFLASGGTFTFGTPKRSVKDGQLEFTVEIDGPDAMPAGSAISLHAGFRQCCRRWQVRRLCRIGFVSALQHGGAIYLLQRGFRPKPSIHEGTTMTISVGDKLPEATFKTMTDGRVEDPDLRRRVCRQEGRAVRRSRRLHADLQQQPPAGLSRKPRRHPRHAASTRSRSSRSTTST